MNIPWIKMFHTCRILRISQSLMFVHSLEVNGNQNCLLLLLTFFYYSFIFIWSVFILISVCFSKFFFNIFLLVLVLQLFQLSFSQGNIYNLHLSVTLSNNNILFQLLIILVINNTDTKEKIMGKNELMALIDNRFFIFGNYSFNIVYCLQPVSFSGILWTHKCLVICSHIFSRFYRSPVLIITSVHQQKRTLYSPNLCVCEKKHI